MLGVEPTRLSGELEFHVQFKLCVSFCQVLPIQDDGGVYGNRFQHSLETATYSSKPQRDVSFSRLYNRGIPSLPQCASRADDIGLRNAMWPRKKA